MVPFGFRTTPRSVLISRFAGVAAALMVLVYVAHAIAAGPGIVFESSWDTAIGLAANAVKDGGKWPNYWEFNGGSSVQLLSVVSGGVSGHNALRVQQRGSSFAANLQIDNFIAPSTDYYLRYYMKNDDTSSAGDHIVTVDTYQYPNLTFMRKYGGGSSFRAVMSLYGCGYTYPIGHWTAAQQLSNGQWYRFEYFVHFVDATHVQVHPRVYNAAGTLIMSDAEFQQSDYRAGGSWNGRDDWTLASYYAGGYSFCVDPAWTNDFGLGNNGQQGAADTGQYWYFSGVQLRSDTWPGPVTPASGGDTTPPVTALTSPTPGATVSGAVNVAATASDNVGVAGVQFKLDGAPLGAEDTAAPFSVSWDTTAGTNGTHSLTAVARDAAGNQTTIAASYPGDVGIENNANVVFVEKFEENVLTDLFSRWSDILNGAAMIFSSDVPPGSPGTHSLNIPAVGGGVNTGGHLYKLLSPGVNDTLYVRYYVKYPANGAYVHDGIWMGGHNPPVSWPDPQAGIKPAGNDRFSAAAEQTDDRTHFDHYNYWMNMRVAGDGQYWGNTLLNNPNVKVTAGQWACVEQMVKLNNPVTAFNGEHAIWINGTKVSHLGQGFPNGTWSGGNFTQTTSGTPFEGFRWRSDANLNLNWIWLQNYSPSDPVGVTSAMLFDHVVVAKSYIGCMATATPRLPSAPGNLRIIR
jgi:Big-like domain-containing protein